MEKFNIRVYGILVNDLNQVLISDEYRSGFAFTKFPGGGVEIGEGLPNALKREFIEEIGIEVEVEKLFYFNDFYQASAFNPKHQILAFYYHVKYDQWREIETDQHEVPRTTEGEKHRWIDLDSLDIAMFTFPIDKIVCKHLMVQ